MNAKIYLASNVFDETPVQKIRACGKDCPDCGGECVPTIGNRSFVEKCCLAADFRWQTAVDNAKVFNVQRTESLASERAPMTSIATPDFFAVAKLITSDPPAWLTEFLESWSPTVMLDSGLKEAQPTRAQLLKQLRTIEKATAALLTLLPTPAVRDFLNNVAERPAPLSGDLFRMLRDIQERSMNAAQSSDLVGPDGKPKPGRSRAFLSGTISPRTLCAMVVAEAWRSIKNEYPKARNRKVAEACDLYWRISGGIRPESWGSDNLAAWRPNLKEATKIEAPKLRNEISRHLGIWKQQSSL